MDAVRYRGCAVAEWFLTDRALDLRPKLSCQNVGSNPGHDRGTCVLEHNTLL